MLKMAQEQQQNAASDSSVIRFVSQVVQIPSRIKTTDSFQNSTTTIESDAGTIVAAPDPDDL